MTTRTRARHRKVARPLTPMASLTPAAKRGMAVAATSGLALTMIASGAQAAGESDQAQASSSAGSLEDTGVGAIAAQARDAVATNAAITTAADASTPEDVQGVAEVSVTAPARQEAPAAAARTAAASTAAATPTVKYDVPASAAGSAVAAIAMQYQGAPYVYGGTTPSGWDCSGFVAYVYAQVGISLPHSSYAQAKAGTLVSAAQAQAGDIVYYGGHVGIYMGNGMMIDAGSPRTGTSYRPVYGNPIGYIRVGG